MRLLNVDSRQLKDFTGNAPPYAILSHTWEADEVIFQDLTDPAHVRKAGYYKIDQACRLAKSDGLEYVWVDTCCIDKSSSAELSEAINSMFRWYHESVVCYAFLSDVPPEAESDKAEDFEPYSVFRGSRWFTRGWTLQELLAPAHVVFYNSAWEPLGARNDMRALLGAITAIPEACLGGYHPDSSCALGITIAQRMAWASSRETTRLEDMAYCLMGLFDVHMPLLYGEGDRAFMRLQREILTVHADESILAF
ncbi:heterokaryon incompatibility protein-domain-containing protein, partial [Plectosphaerella plurivora]